MDLCIRFRILATNQQGFALDFIIFILQEKFVTNVDIAAILCGLPWLLRGCPGQPVQMVLQDWYTEDYKVWSAWNETDNKECPLPMIVD